MAKNAMPKSKAKTAYGLLSEIRKLILEEPKRYYQGSWKLAESEPGFEPSCGTVCCVAGWVDALKSKSPATADDYEPDTYRPLIAVRAAKILGLEYGGSALTLFDGAAAGDRYTPTGRLTERSVARHAQRGAAHIATFQKKYAAQLKAKRV